MPEMLRPSARASQNWAFTTDVGYQVYLVQRGEPLCVVLCGGDNSVQQKDIERAQRLTRELED
jgi:putative addiction module killer protein